MKVSSLKRTGIGSDFVIEHDLIENDSEMGFTVSRNERKWLVEVKATRGDNVRMTVTQAKTAVKKREGFLLCVVPVAGDGTDLEEDSIRTNMKFVQDIGPRVESLCDVFSTLSELRNEVTAHHENEIKLELDSGTARIRVNETVWCDGICLKDLPKRLK